MSILAPTPEMYSPACTGATIFRDELTNSGCSSFFYPTRDFYDDWKYHHYLRQVLTFDCECVWSAHFMRLKMFDGVVFLNLSYSLMKK